MYRAMSRSATRERIVAAFLRLAAERGIDSTATRAVALEAGVSELTLFRHFGDKATLMREAIREAGPTERLRSYDVAVDASTPASAAAGLTACLSYLRDELLSRQDLLQFAMAEARRHPELQEELMAGPREASMLLDRALQQAAPQLRPDVDRRAALISLEGLILLTVLWHAQGWMQLERSEWDALLEASVRILMQPQPS